MSARLEVWNASNSAKISGGDLRLADDGVEYAPESLGTTGEKLNEAGSGGVVLPASHPAASTFLPGRVVRVYDSADAAMPVFAWTVGDVEKTRLSEEVAKLTVSGPGLLGQLEQSTVAPWLYGRPTSADRVWNWASPSLNLSGWESQVYNRPGVAQDWNRLPVAWPVSPTFNSWVWSSSYTAPPPPWSLNEAGGQSLFRKKFTAAGEIVIYVAGKRSWDVWLDGVLLDQEPTSIFQRDGYEETYRYVLNVSSGDHHFAMRCRNAGLGLAGIVAACFQVSDGVLGDVLWTSAASVDGWHSLHQAIGSGGSGRFPGYTARQIINELFVEAQDRGELPGWTWVEYGEHEEIEEFAVRVGDSYLSVIEALVASYIDVRVEPATLTLGIYPKGELGQVQSVDIDDGVNLKYLSETVSGEFYNAAQAITARGVRPFRTDSASITANGRRSTTLSLPNVRGAYSSNRIIDTFLDAWSTPLTSLVAEVHRSAGAIAGVNYIVGDTVAINGEPHQCVGITWSLRSDGELDATPEFDTPLASRQKEKQLAVQRLIAKHDAPATATLIDSGTQITSGKVRTEQQTWSWSGDVEVLLPDDDPDDPASLGQPYRPEKTLRLYELEVEINEEDLPDAFANSVFEFNRNAVLPTSPFSWGLFNLTLTTSAARDTVITFGYTVIEPGNRYAPRCVAAGGHVSGRYTAKFADPV